jgi:hypothetical protein
MYAIDKYPSGGVTRGGGERLSRGMGASVKSQVCGYDNRGSKALALANETAVTQTRVHR